MDFISLRQKYSELCYESYESRWLPEGVELLFHYRLAEVSGEDIVFSHRLFYELVEKGKKANFSLSVERQKALDSFVFQIGIAESISYWKLACPARLRIACGILLPEEISFWKKLYYHGLGEFIYLNGIHRLTPAITEENWLELVSEGERKPLLTGGMYDEGVLIPVGGGKDSVVSLEVLRAAGRSNLPFVMSAPQAAYDCIAIAGYDRYLQATRQLDSQLLALNQKGYLNGHVPFSAILAFVAALGAALTGKKYIALSNESSANEPSVPGTTFNHQYSKSLEFEKDFTAYFQASVMPEMEYFSLLRPLYEIEIARAFSGYEAYHQVFRSCNRGKKTNEWCGSCSKCLFVYIILSPYIEREKLNRIFGRDLLADNRLLSIFRELLGLAETKPFECVGTIWEVRYAMEETVRRYGYEIGRSDTPMLVEEFLKASLPQAVPAKGYETGDCLPESFRKLLFQEVGKPLKE